jgi:beta-glucosidase
MYHGYTKLEKTQQTSLCVCYGRTTFNQSNAVFSIEGGQLRAAIDVTNTGERTGDQVIQLYVGFENSAVDRPRRLLRGFKRVTLQPGERMRVEVSCPVDKLRWYNPATSSWDLEGMIYQAYIGFSSRDEDLIKGDFIL